MKIEVGKKYELNNGEVHECTRMRDGDPLHVDRYGYGPFVIGDILYHQDGRFANADADHECSVKREVLTIQTGKYYRTRDGRKVGPMDGVDVKWVRGMDSTLDPEWNNDGTRRKGFTTYDDELIAEWIDTPKTWGEMTDAEKGELLLARYEGRTIQLWHTRGGWVDSVEFGAVEDIAYRIKQEPVRETVEFLWSLKYGKVPIEDAPDYRITFTTTDGKPDLDSIKMEALG